MKRFWKGIKKMFEEMTLAELLKEIEEKRGPYNRDPLTHAQNCIEHMSLCAKELRKRLEYEQVILQSQLDHAIDEEKHTFYDGQLRKVEEILGDEKKP